MRNIKSSTKGLLVLLFFSITTVSCQKYLDVVPDNVSTLDMAFNLRNEAEKVLFTCYSYLPQSGDIWYNPGFQGSDEMWLSMELESHWHPIFRVAIGQQNGADPYFNEWRGVRRGNNGSRDKYKIWRGIRYCNIFLKNMRDTSKVPDITSVERKRWIGEGLFLKAYYHYYMLRMYGPIPIMSENVPVDGDIESSYVKRRPIDECVDSIVSWLDEAVPLLPVRISDQNTELGRITRTIALSIKAKVLVMAASPLFNGNEDYVGFKNSDGEQLFNSTFKQEKWVRARDAVKDALLSASGNSFELYYYTHDRFDLSEEMKTQLSIRNAVTKPFNSEVIWGNTGSYFINQPQCMPPLMRNANTDRHTFQGILSPPIKIAKLFYTKHGVPIDEDKTLDFNDYSKLRAAVDSEKYYIEPGYVTARLNFDRGPRFYADLGFDGSIWYMQDGNPTGSDENTFYVEAKNNDIAGANTFQNWSATGYFVKKLVNWKSTTNSASSGPSWKNYPWPMIRLTDLYLLYAEAENEVSGGSPVAIAYLDKVRKRAGLEGIVESWNEYSTNPNKYSTKEGLREIIHRERTIEFMFEGQRFWDLRRWKEASEVFNQNITGWNINGKEAEDYYNETFIYKQEFIVPRDYFWPIGNYDLRRNPKLVENPGW